MSFQSDMLDAFDAMLEVMREAAPEGACTMRYPVNKAGNDLTGADDYDAIPSPSPDKLELIEGGFFNDYEFSMSVRRSDFSTPPYSGQLLKIRGKVSRILHPEISDLSPLIVLHCGTPQK